MILNSFDLLNKKINFNELFCSKLLAFDQSRWYSSK